MLTQDLLREVFDYDPESGEFTRKVPSRYATRSDPDTERYKAVRIAGGMHRVHRLVWLYVYGEIPKGKVIDHINGDKHDNRLANLRLVDRAQNNRNSKVSAKNSTGYKGVSVKRGGFLACLSVGNKTRYVGTFTSPEEAARAYDKAALAEYGEYAKTNVALGLIPSIPEVM